MSPPSPTPAAPASSIDGGGIPSEREFLEQVHANLPRNYSAHLLHGLLGQTGFRLVQAPTFVPAYLQLLSGSDLVVGLARGAQALGQCLTPIFGATLIEHRRRVLGLGLVVGALMRLQVLFFALAGLLLVGNLRIAAICGFLALFGLFMGMQGVIFNVLRSKVIPVERRGVLSGLRNALAGLVSSGVAYLGGRYLVEPNVLGNGYAVTFLVAFGFTTMGLASLLLMKEPASPTVRVRTSVTGRLRDALPLLRADRDYAGYVVARACARMGQMSLPFCILYAKTQMVVDGGDLGLITAAWQLSSTTTGLFWGLVADRTGFRLIFLVSIAIWMASVAALIASAGFVALLLVFIGIGAGMGGFQMAAQNMVLEFGGREDLPLRIALTNTTAEIVGVIGPVSGGLIALWFGYLPVFWVALAFQGAALAIMWLRVREPRTRGELVLE
ncbi:MAG: MFS transporter [Deltaproteobacteria bacterium]|nr:MFS transporter [Deltaproteobacteria bacterium]